MLRMVELHGASLLKTRRAQLNRRLTAATAGATNNHPAAPDAANAGGGGEEGAEGAEGAMAQGLELQGEVSTVANLPVPAKHDHTVAHRKP